MSFGSLMVACLPTYESIGALAPALLTVARVIQGISVGGEYGTSAAYMSEVALPGRRGFYASFQYVTLIGGQLLATVVLVVLQGETRGAPAPRLLLPLPEYLAEVQKVFGPPGPSSSVR